MTKKKQIEAAIKMLKISYSPYSGFQVGAALLTKSGKLYTGCNIENAAYTPTICAERTALFKAISEGERQFVSIAIVGGKGGAITSFCPPCGVCRQALREFCDPKSFTILLATSVENYKELTLEQLLPEGFGPEFLSF